MRTSSLELENLKASIEETIHHTYLKKYLQKPVIDDVKLCLLTSIIRNTTLSELKKKQYIITTMLVQIALDTHDLVVKSTEVNEDKTLEKKRQLTVLAGDYYSGLYYLLLSEIEDYTMIHVLASAIKEINELKMQIYYREAESFQEYVDLIKKVESLLITRVAEHIQVSQFITFTEEWLLTRKLLQEKKRYLNGDTSPMLANWLEKSTQHTYENLIRDVETILQEKMSIIKEVASILPVHQTVIQAHLTDTIKNFS